MQLFYLDRFAPPCKSTSATTRSIHRLNDWGDAKIRETRRRMGRKQMLEQHEVINPFVVHIWQHCPTCVIETVTDWIWVPMTRWQTVTHSLAYAMFSLCPSLFTLKYSKFCLKIMKFPSRQYCSLTNSILCTTSVIKWILVKPWSQIFGKAWRFWFFNLVQLSKHCRSIIVSSLVIESLS